MRVVCYQNVCVCLLPCMCVYACMAACVCLYVYQCKGCVCVCVCVCVLILPTFENMKLSSVSIPRHTDANSTYTCVICSLSARVKY